MGERRDPQVLGHRVVMDGLAYGFQGLGEPRTQADFRGEFRGRLIGNGGYDQNTADSAGHSERVTFGRPHISNPIRASCSSRTIHSVTRPRWTRGIRPGRTGGSTNFLPAVAD